jgi:hypothetical protein
MSLESTSTLWSRIPEQWRRETRIPLLRMTGINQAVSPGFQNSPRSANTVSPEVLRPPASTGGVLGLQASQVASWGYR